MPQAKSSKQRSPKQARLRLARAFHCDSLQIGWVIREKDFLKEEFETRFLRMLGKGFTLSAQPKSPPISGPLRLSDAATQDVSLSASIQLSEHEKVRVYYIVLFATHRSTPITVGDWPRVSDFLAALKQSVTDDSIARVISGEHRFSKEKWQGKMELPVPLPAPATHEGLTAKLTGVQVSYEGTGIREKVTLFVTDNDLTASTQSVLMGPITADSLETAAQRSHDVALRLVNEIVTRDDA